jgi:hypothetical protein
MHAHLRNFCVKIIFKNNKDYKGYICRIRQSTSKINPMPWPVTHILIAEKLYQQFFSNLDYQAFIIGTCFPDIRYPAKIERQLTHWNNFALSELREKSPFQTGMACHSIVDTAWNQYIRIHQEDLFSIVPHDRPMFHTMKILQDAFLYQTNSDWQSIAAFFFTMLPEQEKYGVNKPMISRWHTMLSQYLEKPPQFEDLEMLKLSLPEELVKEIEAYYLQYQKNNYLRQTMIGFYTSFDTLNLKTR